MAVDALEYDESAEDANPAGALEEILENPERLKDLDLDAFAEELERQVCVYDVDLTVIIKSRHNYMCQELVKPKTNRFLVFGPFRVTATRESLCMISVQS